MINITERSFRLFGKIKTHSHVILCVLFRIYVGKPVAIFCTTNHYYISKRNSNNNSSMQRMRTSYRFFLSILLLRTVYHILSLLSRGFSKFLLIFFKFRFLYAYFRIYTSKSPEHTHRYTKKKYATENSRILLISNFTLLTFLLYAKQQIRIGGEGPKFSCCQGLRFITIAA